MTNGMDRKSLLPTADKKKSRSRKASYCQRLARHLDRFDENPELWMSGRTIYPPPFLRLPPELRQDILFHVLEGDEVRIPRPNSITLDLALVCKQFREDLPAVTRMWDARLAEMNKLCGFERAVMSNLIKDMMGPLETATAALNNQKRFLSSRAQRKAPSRRNMQLDGSGICSRRQRKKEAGTGASSLRAFESVRHRSGGRAASQEENVEI